VTAQSSPKAAIADRLAEARRRTYELIEPLDDEQLNRVYSDILSPLAWDLGHIANFEELWLVQTIGRREPLRGELGRFYDAIENPRKTRGELPILRDAELRAYLADVRERTLEVLDEVEIAPDAEDPLLRDGFVYEMLLAHELQHQETMLQLVQMVDGYELPA
jgi:gamma-glutamyl hercynylcysteine S-oxide synthase